MAETAQPAVILVHGLYMKRWTWGFFRRYLQRQGFKVYVFGYKTTGQPFARSVMQLQAFINSRPEETVHLVAHSMGGILSLNALPKVNKPGCLVMLGSPLCGSAVARRLQKKGWDKRLLHHATEPLTEGAHKLTTGRPSLMIAGTSPYGLGRMIEPKLGVSDGTVSLAETQADWLDDHQQLHCSHFGLLVNRKVMASSVEFIQNSTTL